MVVSSLRMRRVALLGIATALTAALAPVGVASANSGSDCTNGVVPLNPYVVNCGLPARGNHTIGAAPDAGAIIACRHSPICLSYYVNYPGTLIVPGYRP
ncbi:hypothetical protein Y900_025770 [Mycolicibacterium aromaticivorans JS19b1 = JCM 16368]|uniref:Uncharacterized protein n=2 Tax=Mycolicibacterium aromaticivorans TaxID=318425 RepID=A0A064CU64_9MYCO|nr:hypothetical protein Y900_025770 [Mycolicibacterium aromaticivorans JS19b1 = JCM 16368]